MKRRICPNCKNDVFLATQELRMDVTVNGSNDWQGNVSEKWVGKPYGPYTCDVCGCVYESLDELLEAQEEPVGKIVYADMGEREFTSEREFLNAVKLDYQYREASFCPIVYDRGNLSLVYKVYRIKVTAKGRYPLTYEEFLARGYEEFYGLDGRKPIYTKDKFNYKMVGIGDYVDQEVIDDVISLTPPAHHSDGLVQMGCPSSMKKDFRTGEYRCTYATFEKVMSVPFAVWEFRGYCFRGEAVELAG